MNREKMMPEIRFVGFVKSWNQTKLKKITIVNPKSELPKQFEYVDLESVVGTEMVSHRTEFKESAPSRAQRLAKKGDVFYQTVRPYQKNNYLYGLTYDNYVFSTGYTQLRPLGDSHFLLSRLQESNFVSRVLDRSTGTSYPSINTNDLSNIEIGIPSELEEEKKIGLLFKQIDGTITLQQQLLNDYKQFKKAMLQQLFPQKGETVPKVRFAGFSDTWELHELGKHIVAFSGKSEVNNQYPVLTSSRRGLFLQMDYYRGNQIASKNNVGYNVVPRGYFTYRHMSDDEIFKFNINELVDFGIVSTLYPVFTTKDELNSIFLQYVLNNGYEFRKYAIMQKQGGSRTYMYLSKLGKLKIHLPQLKEQIKISQFFKQLDETIDGHQQKLATYQELKKALLQRMFV